MYYSEDLLTSIMLNKPYHDSKEFFNSLVFFHHQDHVLETDTVDLLTGEVLRSVLFLEYPFLERLHMQYRNYYEQLPYPDTDIYYGLKRI